MVTPSCDRIMSLKVDDTVFSASTNAPGRPRIPAFRNSREFRAGIEHGHGFA